MADSLTCVGRGTGVTNDINDPSAPTPVSHHAPSRATHMEHLNEPQPSLMILVTPVADTSKYPT